FDNQMIAQAIIAGARVGELSCPTRYMDEASSINLRRSIKYGLGVLKTSGDYWLAARGLHKPRYLDFDPAAECAARLPATATEAGAGARTDDEPAASIPTTAAERGA
ncbi:MAG TPA: hypothetical protein VMG38_18315, partial [Trebonia sp.]|nr:hypothetical protein [Trebonia sp.]